MVQVYMAAISGRVTEAYSVVKIQRDLAVAARKPGGKNKHGNTEITEKMFAQMKDQAQKMVEDMEQANENDAGADSQGSTGLPVHGVRVKTNVVVLNDIFSADDPFASVYRARHLPYRRRAISLGRI